MCSYLLKINFSLLKLEIEIVMKLAFILNYIHSNQGHVMVNTIQIYNATSFYSIEFRGGALLHPTVNMHMCIVGYQA